ncbi:hypothetical protein ACP70R_039342 [Stipagrostis hirtigluma subsp. patula]
MSSSAAAAGKVRWAPHANGSASVLGIETANPPNCML